jgi:hypothetical protein
LSQISWTSTGGPNLSNITGILITKDPNIYASTWGDGIYKLTPPWAAINADLQYPSGYRVYTIVEYDSKFISPGTDRRVLIGTDWGAYYYNNGSWIRYSTIGGQSVPALVTKEYPKVAGGYVTWIWAGTNQGVWYSPDGGTTWEQRGLTNLSIGQLIRTENDNLYATSGKTLYCSTNRGETWTPLNTSIFSGTDISAMASNTDNDIFVCTSNIFATSTAGVFRSTDNGATWYTCHGYSSGLFGQPPYKQYSSIAIHSNGTIFLGTWDGSVYLSTENGDSWGDVSTGISGSIGALAFDSDGYVYAGGGAVVYKSNEKATEIEESISRPGTPSGETNPETGQSYTYTTSGSTSNLGHAVEYSFNWGDGTSSSWSTSRSASYSWSTGGTKYVTVTARCRTHTDKASSSDILVVNVVETSVDGEPTLPTQFELNQNYPNPFNPSTQIRFTLPRTSFVSLKIYDHLGKEIQTLLHEQKQPGEYTIQWIPEDLPSGIYLCRLRAGDYVETRKMIYQR